MRSSLLIGASAALLLAGAFPTPALAQVSSSRGAAAGQRQVTYNVDVTGDVGNTVVLELDAKGAARPFGVSASDGCDQATVSVSVADEKIEWQCVLTQPEATIALVVRADSTSSRYGTSMLTTRVGANNDVPHEVDGLTNGDGEWFQAIIGGGLTWLQDDHEDFAVSNGALLVSNDSQLRASAIVGGLFRIRRFDSVRRQVSALVSLQFTQGTPNAIDGFAFGIAWEINPILHATVGYSIRKGQELSPGFRRAADAMIRQQLEAGNAAYERFSDWNPSIKNEKLLDGLSVNTPGTDMPFFPGAAVVDSYNSAWFIGVVMPVRLQALFSPGEK